MLKKTIKYEDFNGVEIEEDFYFNLTKSELLKMEMGEAGGMTEKIKKIVAAQDAPAIMDTFENIISLAYGEKSADGKRFVKSKEISEAFMQTPAYDILFMELVTDADAASKFINAIAPEIPEQKQIAPAAK